MNAKKQQSIRKALQRAGFQAWQIDATIVSFRHAKDARRARTKLRRVYGITL